MAAQFSQTTRSLNGDTGRMAMAAWVVGAACLAGWGGWFFLGSVTVYEVSQRARVEVRQSPHPVHAEVAGRVVATSLAVGADVAAGEALVTLDDASDRLRLDEAHARLDALGREIASVRREMAAREDEKASDRQSGTAAADAASARAQEIEAAEAFARDYEARMRRLSAEGLVASVDLARAEAEAKKLAASRGSLASDLRRLELDGEARLNEHEATIESLQHALAVLQGEVATTQAAAARLETDVARHVVRAPVAGGLGSVAPLQPGTYVTVGQQLATVVPSGELIVVADFSPAVALGRVRPGQQARLRLDGFPWAEFGTVAATVTRVSSELRDGLVRVELALAEGAATAVPMQHGLPGRVEVAVEQTGPAVLALRAAGLLLAAPDTSPRVAGAPREQRLGDGSARQEAP